MSQPLALRAAVLLADLLVCWGGQFDGVGDTLRYAGNGEWATGVAEPTEWCYAASAGCASAQQYAYGQLPRAEVHRERAVATIDRSIALFQFPDGGFHDYVAGQADSDEIATYFWGVEMATAYLALRPHVGRRPSWERSLARACDFLEAKRVVSGDWYINGNIQLGFVELCELTYLATGDATHQAMAARALEWAKNPTISTHNVLIGGGGYGWVEEVVPTLADGSDGKGYFRESDGVTTPGVDWRYLHLQSAVLARLYLATGRAEYLRMTNMALGKLMERVNTTTWMVDLTGGARYPTGSDPFYSPAMFVAAWKGGTSSWNVHLDGVMTNIEATLRIALNQRTPNYMRDSSKFLATIVRAGA